MDTYTHYKSSRPKVCGLKKSNKGKRRRRSFSPTPRSTDISNITKDLEQEYLRPSCRHGLSQPASAFVDWFFSTPDNEFEGIESATSEGTDGSEERSLEEVMGEEAYKAMLDEHIEAEKQLERKLAVELEMQLKEVERAEREKRVNEDVGDESWDLISTGSVEFDDWEKVVVE
jgi:hypothetical protein